MVHAQYLLIEHLLNTLIIKDSNKMEVRQKPLTTHLYNSQRNQNFKIQK